MQLIKLNSIQLRQFQAPCIVRAGTLHGTLEQSGAVINVINNTCAFPTKGKSDC